MISKAKADKCRKMIAEHGLEEASKLLGYPVSTVERYARLHRDKGDTQLSTEIENGNMSLISKSSEIRTVEDLLEYANIDTDIWMVSKQVVNCWGSADNPSYQVKAWLKERTEENKTPEDFAKDFNELMATYESPVVPKVTVDRSNGACMLEVSIHDMHLGQLSWGKETRHGNYDVKIASALMVEAVGYIVNQAQKNAEIDQVVFVTGSDFFNVNSKLNTTSHGTPQDEEGRWKKTFVNGLELNMTCIDLLHRITKAPVHVIVVCGNHDEEKAFYMGCALETRYRNDENIHIDNTPPLRKYYLYGNTLLQVTHGAEEKKKNQSLPMLANIECRELMPKIKFVECQSGHYHHESKDIKNLLHDEFGYLLRLMPSLVAPSYWASASGYLAARKSIGLMYTKENGLLVEIPFNL